MKLINSLTKIVAVAGSFMMLVSCTDDFDSINTNPSLVTPEVMDGDMLLTKVLKNSVFSTYQYNRLTEMAGYAENQGTSVVTERNNSDPLMSHTREYIKPLNHAIDLWEDDPLNANKIAIARIWKAWVFHIITDSYGDVPYFQAGLPVDEAVDQPEYDPQEEIYNDMLNELQEAEAMLTDSEEQLDLGAADIIYNGDINKWRRFANSLRFRLAIRVRYADPQLASDHISDIMSNNKPLIEMEEDMAYIQTEGETADNTSNRNPLYNRSINANIPVYANMTISEVLQMRDDPRLPIYLNPAPEPRDGDMWRGRPTNVSVENQNQLAGTEGQWADRYTREATARLGDLFQEAEYRIKVLHAPEVYFLRAEAALFGLTNENAQELHREGIRQAMALYDVDQAEVDDYMQTGAANLSGSQEDQLREIIVQKYIANYWLSQESWSEHRRTGYPVTWIGTRGDVYDDEDRELQRRYQYPFDEDLKNSENVNEAVSRLSNGDTYRSKFWWDAKEGVPIPHPNKDIFPPERDFD
ncbi:Starch-binding associating with outer membrane [Fodinibius roseus]|uniref:Starch-binding associating with outer membrane n=1 Tax=Fodinibius roseus TaxID=1194090 RepID=A0A1M5JM05_9BACT|nr:SusD/RagB family nutrient-binding outer membrane lipoprotein [Fodinibius roseus]SHG41063.1 Starch-binding associating with outer membrane [Fodinibius roseus]